MNKPYIKQMKPMRELRRVVKRKWVETVEIPGEGSFELQPGQRVVDSRIIHEVVELKQPGGIGSPAARTRMPEYKTVVVLECVEYEDVIDD